LSIDEMDERKKQVARWVVRTFIDSRMGQLYQDPECDKYIFEHGAEVDCQIRCHVCKVLCCKFLFALSRRDVKEGAIRW
ncbi:MAG: hypothetical protein MIO93_05870, partial [ANME-2 cluster archaeon]|nr:hypothetical protein [ANME-2 cluster archaeon]